MFSLLKILCPLNFYLDFKEGQWLKPVRVKSKHLFFKARTLPSHVSRLMSSKEIVFYLLLPQCRKRVKPTITK